MTNKPTPDQILQSTTRQVYKLIEEILKIEKEYQNYQNLSQLKEKENELCERIGRLIEREIKE